MTGLDVVGLRRVLRVIVADDVRANRELAAAHLETLGCALTLVADGEAALAAAAEQAPDLVILDVMMPGLDGISVCQILKGRSETRFTPIILVTALDESEARVLAYQAGADDFLTKPVSAAELLARSAALLKMKILHDRLDDSQRVIVALAKTIQAKDMRTESHTERVADWARRLAAGAGMSGIELDDVYLGAVVHDVGKIGVPDAILLKPGPLDPAEMGLMRNHVLIGEEILSPLRSVAHLGPIVRNHHERIDGHGYPDRMAGVEIPLPSRVVAICDAFDAMVSDRPYRLGLPQGEATRRLAAGRDLQWDSELVNVFLADVLPQTPRRGSRE